MDQQKKKRLDQETSRLNKQYGHRTGALGSDEVKLNVTSTGILGLDYALGTGGWPKGYIAEVFGPPDIGKSSVIGFNALRMAQKEGNLCGIIALEPNFDPEWARKNGLDPESIVIARPSTGEDAFNILYDWVSDDLVDMILFDSIGAVLRGSEIEAKAGKAKPGAGGQAALITWGVKRVILPAWKNNKTVIFLNQIRDVMDAQYSMVDSPGGHALKHGCSIRVQLKPGRDKYFDGETLVGRKIVADVKRNKLAEGTNQRALFDFYQADSEAHPVGIDLEDDLINVGKKTGIITGTGWLKCDLFPKESVHGKPGVKELLAEDPALYDRIRDKVIEVMLEREGVPSFAEPEEE